MSVADPDETDNVGDLTETDFFERARWAATGEPFDAPAFARAQLRDLAHQLERARGEERRRVEPALAHVRAALRALEGDAA